MLEHGADLNLQTRFGNLDSVLHLAISMGAFRNRNILTILMKYGASLSLKNKLGNAPLEHCLVQFNEYHQSAHKYVQNTFKTFLYFLH